MFCKALVTGSWGCKPVCAFALKSLLPPILGITPPPLQTLPQTIERAHTPKNLWQKIRLKKNYMQALEQVCDHQDLECNNLPWTAV